MDNNQIYTQDATPVEAAPVQTKKKGIKYIVLGIIAIALIIAVAIVVSNFMSKGSEEPNDLFYKNRIAYYDAEKDLWGYADKKGKKVIKAKYDEAYNYAECGLALVCNEDGKYGYIDTNGKTAIKFKYIAASSFNEHNLAVAVDEAGVVVAAQLDVAQQKVQFDLEGVAGTTDLRTKVEKKEDYGMKGVSGIGKEYYEQSKAFTDWMVGKTTAEVSGMATYERDASHTACPDVEDLKASCTITVGDYLKAFDEAVATAK